MKVALFTLGGTIASTHAPGPAEDGRAARGVAPGLGGADLVAAVPGLDAAAFGAVGTDSGRPAEPTARHPAAPALSTAAPLPAGEPGSPACLAFPAFPTFPAFPALREPWSRFLPTASGPGGEWPG